MEASDNIQIRDAIYIQNTDTANQDKQKIFGQSKMKHPARIDEMCARRDLHFEKEQLGNDINELFAGQATETQMNVLLI